MHCNAATLDYLQGGTVAKKKRQVGFHANDINPKLEKWGDEARPWDLTNDGDVILNRI